MSGGDAFVKELFPDGVSLNTIRNIRRYENYKRKLRGLSGPEYMLNHQCGLDEWCRSKSIDQPGFTWVKDQFLKVVNAVEEDRLQTMAELRDDTRASNLSTWLWSPSS